ncbi:MAG TPA: outer membrane protein assembly factor BamD [Anaeromyxobacteraceae bacterium]|nr:outer membrane protein assembly factor BamD [Anaeromyxobacteraceae bacterium]
MRRLSTAFAPLLALALLLGCGSSRVSISGEMKYGKTAEENFNFAEEELKEGNDVEAVKFFEFVRTKYPFSKYSALAELRLADMKYDKGRWIEAADAYKDFLKLHPTHENADRAAVRVGLAHWNDAPGDLWLFPPAYEKDQVSVRDAAKELKEFLEKFPDSKYRPEAEKVLALARRRLADHEWYVAQFYAKRDLWAGAAGRLETLVREYPGTPHEQDALIRLAEVYVKMDERFRAQQALQQLIVKHPGSPRRAEAEKLLAQLR